MRLGLKFAMVIGMTLAILVPLLMIRGVIEERQSYRNEVVRDIAGKYGGRQTVAGPVLVVPYEENDGRGKDRPVLVIGRQSADRVFAVRLTSKAHDGDRDFLPIGSGAWDSQGRPSWVDIEQVYSVHREGMRREASAIDVKRFAVVAQALQRRYGWQAGE